MLTSLLSAFNVIPVLTVIFLLMQLLMSKTGGQVVSFQDKAFLLTPSIEAMPKAVRLNDRFKQILAESSALFVFGGENTHPNASGSLPALKINYRGQSLGALDAFPYAECKSSLDVFNHASAQLGPFLENREGFTALCLKDKSTLSGILHFAKYTNAEHIFYETVLFHGDNLQEKMAYRVCLRANEGDWSLHPGVSHIWNEHGGETQAIEAGVLISLPDPCLTPGAKTDSFSRFTYFEDVLR